MNTSFRTKHIANGMALYATFQNTSPVSYDYEAAKKAWEHWCYTDTRYIEFVIKEHRKLFDEINATFF